MKRLAGEFFYVDRWLGSSAAGLPLEARGLYREMLSRAWLMGGRLPADLAQVQRLVGATAAEWRRSWPLVARYWRVEGAALVNDTQRTIYAEAEKRATRARHGGAARAQTLFRVK